MHSRQFYLIENKCVFECRYIFNVLSSANNLGLEKSILYVPAITLNSQTFHAPPPTTPALIHHSECCQGSEQPSDVKKGRPKEHPAILSALSSCGYAPAAALPSGLTAAFAGACNAIGTSTACSALPSGLTAAGALIPAAALPSGFTAAGALIPAAFSAATASFSFRFDAASAAVLFNSKSLKF